MEEIVHILLPCCTTSNEFAYPSLPKSKQKRGSPRWMYITPFPRHTPGTLPVLNPIPQQIRTSLKSVILVLFSAPAPMLSRDTNREPDRAP
jgi:hypothetical protein